MGIAQGRAAAGGQHVKSKEAEDFSQMMAKLGSISVKVEKVVDNLERTTGALADEELSRGRDAAPCRR